MSKRLFDVVVGVAIAIVLVPAMAVIALLIAVTDRPPILLRQRRVGANEKTFVILKFRTMATGAPTVAKADLKNVHVRYTRMGPFLRRSSLDELPQIFNVLIGDMSLVGPRPALPTQGDLLELRRRKGIDVMRPGMTGFAQVKGRESLTLSTKTRFEALYRRRASRALDLLILAWTVRSLFRPRGAY